MKTDKRSITSAENGRKSSGPKLRAGIEKCSQSALGHGFHSTRILLPWDDPEAYAAHQKRFADSYQPRDPVEEEIIHHIANNFWRLYRYDIAEAAQLELSSQDTSAKLELELATLEHNVTDKSAVERLIVLVRAARATPASNNEFIKYQNHLSEQIIKLTETLRRHRAICSNSEG